MMTLKEYLTMSGIISLVAFIILLIFFGLQNALFVTIFVAIIHFLLYMAWRFFHRRMGRRKDRGKIIR